MKSHFAFVKYLPGVNPGTLKQVARLNEIEEERRRLNAVIRATVKEEWTPDEHRIAYAKAREEEIGG